MLIFSINSAVAFQKKATKQNRIKPRNWDTQEKHNVKGQKIWIFNIVKFWASITSNTAVK